MGLFLKKAKTYEECDRDCDEAEERSCDDCINSVNCKKDYAVANREECWQCRYKTKEGNKCFLSLE